VSTIAVLGAGGVGGFVAAALARAAADPTADPAADPAPDVVVVAREPTASQLAAGGFSVRSRLLGEFEARPRICSELTTEVDALLVATKATGLDPALARIVVRPRLIVPLLNGLDHLDRLRERFGAERVAAGVIRIESDRLSPGVIVQTSPSCRIDMATGHAALEPELARLAARLQAAGIPVRVQDDERRVMWSKLVRLCPLALTTSASDRPIGFVRSDSRWRSALENAVAETARVANADGAGLDAADTLAELDDAHAELGSSMQRDIAAGRETELDAIAGAVLRAGARLGQPCPTVEWLTGRVAARAGIEAYSGGRTGGAGPST
jgi:2-dehydropantoate 2-reductase